MVDHFIKKLLHVALHKCLLNRDPALMLKINPASFLLPMFSLSFRIWIKIQAFRYSSNDWWSFNSCDHSQL